MKLNDKDFWYNKYIDLCKKYLRDRSEDLSDDVMSSFSWCYSATLLANMADNIYLTCLFSVMTIWLAATYIKVLRLKRKILCL